MPKPDDQVAEARRMLEETSPDHQKVLRLLMEAAENGSPEASYALGTWYAFGKYVEQDFTKANKFFEEAAKKGYADAMLNLAVSFELGKGLAVDYFRAFDLYLSAAIRGEPRAVFEVSRCYEYGIGITSDKRLADLWADRAEELGTYIAGD